MINFALPPNTFPEIVPTQSYTITDWVRIDGHGITFAGDNPINARMFYAGRANRTGMTAEFHDVHLVGAPGVYGTYVGSGATLMFVTSSASEFPGDAFTAGQNATLWLDGSSVEDNAGSGIIVNGGRVALWSSVIARNVSPSWGGGVQATDADVDLYDTTFEENESVLGGGGVSAIASFVSAEWLDFERNHTSGMGGGLLVGESALDLQIAVFAKNGASKGGGMAVYTSIADVRVAQLQTNTASTGGGGAWVYNPDPTRLTTTWEVVTAFDNVTAESGGGGLSVEGIGADVDLSNVTFSNNAVLRGSGGDIWVSDGADATLTHVTAADGRADHGGALGGATPHKIILENTILAAAAGGDCDLPIGVNDTASLSIDGTCRLTGVGSQDRGTPLLLPLGVYNGGWTNTRPADSRGSGVDVGDAGLCLPLDQNDVRRPAGKGCDIGATER